MKSLPNVKTIVVTKPTKKVEMDIFDEVELQGKNVFKKLPPEEIEKIKAEERMVRKVKEVVLATLKLPDPQVKVVEKIIEKITEPEEDEGPDEEDIKLEELRAEVDELKATIEEQKKLIDEMNNAGPIFIPASPIIPTWVHQSDKILSNNGTELKWVSKNTSSETYTTSNVTTRRTIDADDTSLDELADLVSSLIVDLQTAGVLK